MKSRVFRVLSFLGIGVLAGNLSLLAQQNVGRITGTVSDPSGAIVPGAKVVATNTATQFKVEMLTNKYQADKISESPNIANIEFQRSLQRYTIAVDLHRIGNEMDEIGTRISPGTNTEAKDLESDEFKRLSSHDAIWTFFKTTSSVMRAEKVLLKAWQAQRSEGS